MRRQIAYVLAVLLVTVAPLHAVNLTGDWFVCLDCRVPPHVCDPFSMPPNFDTWDATQTGTNLSVDSSFWSQTFTGPIDSATGAFTVSYNSLSYTGDSSTFATIDGTYNAVLQTGKLFGARCDKQGRCPPHKHLEMSA
jgi:hypothetical protein